MISATLRFLGGTSEGLPYSAAGGTLCTYQADVQWAEHSHFLAFEVVACATQSSRIRSPSSVVSTFGAW